MTISIIIAHKMVGIALKLFSIARACFKTIKVTKAKCKREKQPHGSRRLFSHPA